MIYYSPSTHEIFCTEPGEQFSYVFSDKLVRGKKMKSFLDENGVTQYDRVTSNDFHVDERIKDRKILNFVSTHKNEKFKIYETKANPTVLRAVRALMQTKPGLTKPQDYTKFSQTWNVPSAEGKVIKDQFTNELFTNAKVKGQATFKKFKDSDGNINWLLTDQLLCEGITNDVIKDAKFHSGWFSSASSVTITLSLDELKE